MQGHRISRVRVQTLTAPATDATRHQGRELAQ
jgi:hypothetical protein